MARKITASQVNKIAKTLDGMAEFFEKSASQLGIPQSVGTDFAYRCDLLADAIEKKASPNTTLTHPRRFDPSSIGQTTPGPLRRDDDERYLQDEYTGEEFSALSDMIEGGHDFHTVSLLEGGLEDEDEDFYVESDALNKMAFDLFASEDDEDEDDEDEDEEDGDEEDGDDEDEEDEDDEDEEDEDEEDEDDEDEKTQKKARLILAALNLIASEDDDEDEDEEDEDEDDDDDEGKSAAHLSSAHKRKLSESAKKAHNRPRKKRTQAERTTANKARTRSRARGARV